MQNDSTKTDLGVIVDAWIRVQSEGPDARLDAANALRKVADDIERGGSRTGFRRFPVAGNPNALTSARADYHVCEEPIVNE